jgi:hypothetical protein
MLNLPEPVSFGPSGYLSETKPRKAVEIAVMFLAAPVLTDALPDPLLRSNT